MEKIGIVIVFILQLNLSFGQQLTFGGQPVDTITIRSSSGHYRFDKKGTTSGLSNSYIISYNKNEGKYIVTDHFSTSTTHTSEPSSTKEKIKNIKIDIGKVILTSYLNELLNSFTLEFKPPTFNSTGLTSQEFHSLTSEKKVREVAKSYKEQWHFKMAYSTKEENKIIFDGCQSVDTFNIFLKTKFIPTGFTIVTDYWDDINIRIKTSDKSFSVWSSHPNIYRQPWFTVPDTVKDFVPIVNLKINKCLLDILPDSFYRRNTIELKALADHYIKWYLQRRDIISKFD